VDKTIQKSEFKVIVLCRAAKMSRQNYYKLRCVRRRRTVDEAFVSELVKRERRLQPMLGTRKLLHILSDEFCKAGIRIGRDRLFEVLRGNKLLILKRRGFKPRTTDSRHRFGVYDNLLKDAVLTSSSQAVVSDITYIRTGEGFMYVSLVMDAYSRAIVGYDCSESLSVEGAFSAMRMAMKNLKCTKDVIHHSDRGLQYCCGEYVKLLMDSGFRISMTQENHCYQNASAERLNGILKQEYGLGGRFLRKSDVSKALREAVDLYNWRRPHQALGYRVPMEVHAAA
jgi:putative transposase